MKIIIINGSPRTNGLTATLLRGIENRLLEKGAEVQYYDLGKLNMAHCAGCCNCYTTGHCHINDDATMLSEMISDADGLVLGSPTYASNVSGPMKVLIDRGHFVIEQLLTDKQCVTVTSGENYGSRDANKVLNRLVLYSGGNLADKIVINAPFNDVSSVSDKVDKLSRCSADKLYSSISKKKRNLFQKAFHSIVLNIGIRPLVKKKGPKYQGVIDKWKELGIYG